MSNWPTKDKDLTIANKIIGQYAKAKNMDAVGFVEVFIDVKQKAINLCLSDWVRALAKHYYQEYGLDEGEVVMRHVLSSYIVNGETVH